MAVVATPSKIPAITGPRRRIAGTLAALAAQCLGDHFVRLSLRQHFLTRVCRSLHPEQTRVAAVQVHQLLVRALLDELAVLQEDDAVGSPHGGETVRDVDRR